VQNGAAPRRKGAKTDTFATPEGEDGECRGEERYPFLARTRQCIIGMIRSPYVNSSARVWRARRTFSLESQPNIQWLGRFVS
jgi:hypothetical protein